MAAITEKKIALVTGANKGLGFEISKQLARSGIFVFMGCRDEKKGVQAVEDLRGETSEVDFVKLDVCNDESVMEAENTIRKKAGHLDILINNAGISMDFDTLTSEIKIDVWEKTFDTNLFGAIRVTSAMLELLKKSQAGRIVNVSSILGSVSLNAAPDSPISERRGFMTSYDASKAALNMYTIHLASELKNNHILVNSAHPGWVRTDLGGPEAPMSIEEGVRTIYELATLSNDGPTGQFIHMGEVLPW